MRLISNGQLDDEKNMIKRKKHNNDNFYEDDDFINDDEDLCKIQKYTCEYDDYFCFKGNIKEFKKSSLF